MAFSSLPKSTDIIHPDPKPADLYRLFRSTIEEAAKDLLAGTDSQKLDGKFKFMDDVFGFGFRSSDPSTIGETELKKTNLRMDGMIFLLEALSKHGYAIVKK